MDCRGCPFLKVRRGVSGGIYGCKHPSAPPGLILSYSADLDLHIPLPWKADCGYPFVASLSISIPEAGYSYAGT
jgi:hypothetical protein